MGTKKEGSKKSEKAEKTKKVEKLIDDDEKAPQLKSDPMEYQREMEKKKRIHKAREALSTSMKQKKKGEQEEQDRLDEIQRKIDDERAMKRAEVEETQRIQQEVADRIRKKQEKEEEKIKFLKWKEEKSKKEKEQREKEGVEYDERAKRNLQKKKEEMAAKEIEAKKERDRITQETEWAWQRKLMESGAPKIDRENVEDELDRGDCLTIGTEEKFENENEEGV